MMFISPQTGNTYTIVNTNNDIFVCYRELDNNEYRVRIQGNNPNTLAAVRTLLHFAWGSLKDDDHYSVVVSKGDLPFAVADAIKAIVLATI